MIDPKLIRRDIGSIRELLVKRSMDDVIDLDHLIKIDEERRDAIARIDKLRETRNRISKEIGNKKAKGEDDTELRREVQAVSEEIKGLDMRVEEYNEDFNSMVLSLPNLLDESVPIGKDENDNKVVRIWGEKPDFSFNPKPHYDIGVDLGILDFERGVKLSGARFYVYRGLAARLERALISFMLDLHTKEHGYTETFGPFIVNDDSMIGTG